MRRGKISVKAENILPIIKKWRYSDKDIFLREVISNASDAIFKFERLVGIGKAEKQENEKFGITVSFNREARTLTIADNGIGMTEEEIKEYIAQVAFSSAVDFFEKYKEITDQNGIIGHFGLGFYSVFMVSDLVEIDTLSYQLEAHPVKWLCDGVSSYQLGEGERQSRGTTITLHINEESKEFLEEYQLKEVIKKYCSFISYEIVLQDETKEKNGEEKNKPLNNIYPLWLKNTKDCSEQEYKQFYKEVFRDYQDPLFWLHLNIDFPFLLKAVIYFPRIREDISLMEQGEIKLYYNQVFVADNIKEILPDFLMVLKGVIDCPDIPINVSRSFLQNNGTVVKISNLIARKVSDKLHAIFNDNRDEYEKYWEDIQLLIKFGCIRDGKFFDRMKDAVLFQTTDEKYFTLTEYLDKKEDKEDKTIYYTDNKSQLSSSIELYRNNGLEVVEFNHPIDTRLSQKFEIKEQGVKFVCVTAELPDSLTSGQIVDVDDIKKISDLFKTAFGKEQFEVTVKYLKDDKTPILLMLPEQSKRLQELSKNYGGGFSVELGENYSIVINRGNTLIEKLLQMDVQDLDKAELLCRQLYDIALMSHRELNKEEKERFVKESYELFELL